MLKVSLIDLQVILVSCRSYMFLFGFNEGFIRFYIGFYMVLYGFVGLCLGFV